MPDHRPLAFVRGESSGIGYELAAQLAQRGYDVAIPGQSERVFDSAEALEGFGGEAYPHQADASTYDGVESFWQFVTDLDRFIAVACLNVGIGVGRAFVENDLEDELRMIAIDCAGPVHMAKRVVQAMIEQGQGERRILVVSSVSATTPTPYEPVFGPTKASGSSSRSPFARSCARRASPSRRCCRARPTPTSTPTPAWATPRSATTAGRTTRPRSPGRASRRRRRRGLVVGGDEATEQQAVDNRTTSETENAARQGAMARPSSR